ncbi:hypothetical protein IT570_04400 [Candidatus Sumerlaeota bacterium]|nr:hypothetical protein [Candidatus Sumerlaeota bacterium]
MIAKESAEKIEGRSGKLERLFFHVLIAVVSCVAPSAAQVQKYRSVSATQIAPGLRTGVLMFTGTNGATRIAFTEAQLGTPRLSAEVEVSSSGPMGSSRLADLAAAGSAKSLMGIDLQPAAGQAQELSGLFYNRRSLLSWPPAARWHLTSHADGTCELGLVAPMPGRITVANGATLGLVSLNGVLPTDDASASVYTGRLSASDSPVVQWPAGLRAALLAPVRDGAPANGNFVAEEGVDTRFRILRILNREDFKCDDGQALLVFRASMGDAVFQDAEFVTVQVDLAASLRLASFIVPVGDPLMMNGATVEGLDPDRIVMNAIAVDGGKKKVMVLSYAEAGRGATLTAGQLVEYLRELKYTNANFLPGQQPALLAKADEGDQLKELEATRARAALAFVTRPARLQAASEGGDLFAISGIAIQPVRREFSANQVEALMDHRSAPAADLRQFWAIPFLRVDELGARKEEPNTLLLALPKVTRIGAVEVVNVESVGFSPQFDLKHFRILGRQKKDMAWEVLAELNAASPSARYMVNLHGTPLLLEMKLEILEPSFLPNGDVARIAELVVWGAESGL